MITVEAARKIAIALPEVNEYEHWERPAFRVKKKIFLTLWPVEKRAVVKLSPEDQSVFCYFDKAIFYPVQGAWGRQGWTMIELKKVRKDMFKDAVTLSWRQVVPKKLSSLYPTDFQNFLKN